jgi:hypothetical protein
MPLFKSNYPVMMILMTSFTEKVKDSLVDNSWIRSKLLMMQAQV